MNRTLNIIRGFFAILVLSLSAIHSYVGQPTAVPFFNIMIGISVGIGALLLLFALEKLLSEYPLKTFNVAILGLFLGYFLGQALLLILDTIWPFPLIGMTDLILRSVVMLFSVYLGLILTARASDEVYASIPFVRLQSKTLKKKDMLVDISAISDTRILDLASSGILDHQLIIPHFVIKELREMAESDQEMIKNKAKRTLEVIQKLETLPGLDLRYSDAPAPEGKDLITKLIALARHLDSNLLTADINRVQQAAIEGVRVINIHVLSNALKPIAQNGEWLQIKVQRYGKEPRQGVGYLDDGTMVVINGGADYIGETIKAQVLSVKHTSSGRMIFCNAPDEVMDQPPPPEFQGAGAKNYFTYS